ncbi:hypothetical protein [Luedemannella helvata]|uniref:hypothetical protein n=1 Tax=Luedemannella helvata TaxID=349315 RepID=UPI0031D9BC27
MEETGRTEWASSATPGPGIGDARRPVANGGVLAERRPPRPDHDLALAARDATMSTWSGGTVRTWRPIEVRPWAEAGTSPNPTVNGTNGRHTTNPGEYAGTHGAEAVPQQRPPVEPAAPAPPAPPAATVGEKELPQRVPSEPDVPEVPLSATDPLVDPASAPVHASGELSRIADYLRTDASHARVDTVDGFDVAAVLAAVRSVRGVRDAQLRWNPGGVHSLRLDLAEGADAGRVSREVARLLKDRMGLAAEPNQIRTVPDNRQPPARPAPVTPAGFGASAAAPVTPAGYGANGASPAALRPPADGRPWTEPASPRAEPERPWTEPVRPREAPDRPSPDRHSPDRPSPGMRTVASGSATVPSGRSEQHAPRPLRPADGRARGPRVVLDHVQVTTLGMEATVEVRLTVKPHGRATGTARGPAVDGYVLRLAAAAAGSAVDELLLDDSTGQPRGRIFIEHVALVPFAGCEVALVVLLLVCEGWVEQLAGSSIVAGDPRQAVVRATLSALNRRLDALLS